MLDLHYSLTFEFDYEPTITEVGRLQASSARTAVARAVDEARKRHKNVKWRSLVVVIERHWEGHPGFAA